MESQKQQIFSYLGIFYRRRYLVLCVAMVVTALVIGISYRLPKKYQADSTVLIETNVISSLVKGIAVSPDIDSRIRVLRYAMLSRDMITKTLTEMDSGIFVKSDAEQQEFVSAMQQRVKISTRGHDLFTVSLEDGDPRFCQQFINTLVTKYVDENLSSKRDETYGANRFLQEQIDLFKHKLDDAENAIIEMRRSQGIYLPLDEGSVMTEIKALQDEAEKVEQDIDELRSRKATLSVQLKSISPTLDFDIFAGGLEEGPMGEDPRIKQLEERLKVLLLNYTEQYPEVIRIRALIEALRAQSAADQAAAELLQAGAGQVPGLDSGQLTEEDIGQSGEGKEKQGATSMTSVNPMYQAMQQKIMDLDAEISSLATRKRRIAKSIAEREQSLREVPVNRKQLSVLVQERDSIRTVYQQLLGRLGQSEVSKQMEIGDKASTFRIVDPAVLPETPVFPDMVKMILLAMVLGLGCGGGLAFLLDFLDSSLRNPQQLEAMGLPLLAMIPNIDDGMQVIRTRRRDALVYGISVVYFGAVMGLLVFEKLYR